MEEISPPEKLKSVLVLSAVVLLVEGSEFEELVISSPPPLVRRTEEGEELVCGTELTGRQNSISSTQPVSVWSEVEEKQGGGTGRAWQHDLPFKVEDSVCAEPHLEVDWEVIQKEGIEETWH